MKTQTNHRAEIEVGTLENSEHWMDGGFALTNFSPDQEEFYKKVIAEFGDPNFFIIKESFIGSPAGSFSLHYKNIHENKTQTSAFWDMFRTMRQAES